MAFPPRNVLCVLGPKIKYRTSAREVLAYIAEHERADLLTELGLVSVPPNPVVLLDDQMPGFATMSREQRIDAIGLDDVEQLEAWRLG